MDDIFSKLRKRYGLPETETPSEQKPSESVSTPSASQTPAAQRRTQQQVYKDFRKELESRGVRINSGYRTRAQQEALYKRLPKGQAARPGTSEHERWGAVDLPPNVSQKVLEEAARAARVRLKKRNVHKGTGWHNHQGFTVDDDGQIEVSDNFDALRAKYGLPNESDPGPDFDALRAKFGLGSEQPTTQPSPTNPVTQTVKTPPALPDQTQTIGGTQKLPVMPESPMTLEAQMTATADMGSSRKATLLTSADQVSLLPKPALRGLKKLVRPEGIIFYNPAKVKNAESMTTAELIGKVDDVADTSQGIALRTERPDGTELSTSIVTSPESAAQQAQVDQSQFPGQIGPQYLTPAEQALEARARDNTRAQQPSTQRQYQKRDLTKLKQGDKYYEFEKTGRSGDLNYLGMFEGKHYFANEDGDEYALDETTQMLKPQTDTPSVLRMKDGSVLRRQQNNIYRDEQGEEYQYDPATGGLKPVSATPPQLNLADGTILKRQANRNEYLAPDGTKYIYDPTLPERLRLRKADADLAAMQKGEKEFQDWRAKYPGTPDDDASYEMFTDEKFRTQKGFRDLEAFAVERGLDVKDPKTVEEYNKFIESQPKPQAQIRRLTPAEKIQKARERVTQPAQAKGGTFTIETPKELKGSARQYYLGAMASQLAQQYNVSYDTAYKYLAGEIGGGGGTVAQLGETEFANLLTSGKPIQIDVDDAAANELKALEGMMVQSRKNQELAKSLRNAEFDQFYNEYIQNGEIPSVAALLVAKDFGEKEVGGVPIDEAIQRERKEYKKATDAIQVRPRTAADTRQGIDWKTQAERNQEAQDERAAQIRELVQQTLADNGSFTKRAEERRKASEFERGKPMLAAAQRGTEVFKGLIENVPQAASAVLRTADIIGEINPLSVQNVAGYVSGKEFKASEGQLYQAANEIDGIVERVMPRNKYLDGYRKAGNSIGQMAIQMGLGVATGGVATPLLYGASLGASSQYQEADKAGAGKATRQFAAILGGATAISDALPLQWALKPVTKGGVGRLLSGFFNTVYKEAVPELGEKAAKELVESTFRRLVNRSADVAKKIGAGAKKVGTGAGLEMGQEVLIDKKINDLYASLTYDPNRKVFEINNDDLETAFYAAIGGAAAGGGRILLEQYVAAETEAENAPKPEDVLSDPNADAIDKLIAQTEIKEREAQPTEVQPTGETRAKDAATQPPPSPTTAVPSQPLVEPTSLEADTDAQGTVSDVQVEAEAEQPTTAVPPRKRAEKYHDKPVMGMMLEAPLDPQTLEGAKNRLKEVETELQEERRKGSTDAKMGISNERAWQAAVDRIEADPEQEVVSLDINRMKEANDTTSHTGIDKNVLAPIGAAVRKVLKANGIDERNAFRTGGDEVVVAVPKGLGAKIRDEIEKEVGVIEVVATKDFTNDRTGESFKKGDRIPITISGEVGLTVAEAEKGLGARKRASKDANPVRRASAISKPVRIGGLSSVLVTPDAFNALPSTKQQRVQELIAEVDKLNVQVPGIDLGPDQVRRMSKRQKDATNKGIIRRNEIVDEVRQLLKSDKQVSDETREQSVKEAKARLTQMDSYERQVQSMGRSAYKSNGELKAGYQRAFDSNQQEREQIYADYPDLAKEFGGKDAPAPATKQTAEPAREDGAKSPSYRKRLTTIRREMKDEFRARRQDGRELPFELKSAGKRTDKYFEKALDKYVDGMTEPFIRDWHDTIFNKDDSGILRQVASLDDMFDPATIEAELAKIEPVRDETDFDKALGYFDPKAINQARNQNEKSREILISMPIDDFLSVAEQLSSPVPEKAGRVKDAVGRGKKFESLPFLRVDADGKVRGHEGRHRALYLKEQGIDALPVVLVSDNVRWGSQRQGNFDFIEDFPSRLVSEDGKRNIPFPAKQDAYFTDHLPQGRLLAPNGVYNDNGTVNYDKAKDVAERVASGELEIVRLDRQGERGRVAGGSRAIEASILIGADEARRQKASSASLANVVVIEGGSQVGQPLFKLADDESKAYVRETLPTAHTQEVLRGVESKFTANNELELTEEAGEIVRRLLTHVNPSDKGRAFFGVTIDRATLRKAGNAAQKFADEYENIGYAESEVKALRDLGDNLIKLSKAESYGVAYIFEDALPEEQHHALVMNAGGISPEAITKLKKNPLWKSARLTREYGKLSDLSRAVEIAAKLETGQDKYWDKISPKDKKAFLQTVASDIIQRNLDDNGEFGLDEQRYERITKYAENKADNTEGTQRAGTVSDGSQRTQGDAEPARQRDGDQDQAARTRPATQGDGDRAAEVSREKGQRVAAFSRILGQEYAYDPQNHDATEAKASQLLSDKGTERAIHEALYGKPSAEGMRVIQWELERLNGLTTAAMKRGDEAEANAYANQAADLAAKIVQRQVATGQEVEINKKLLPLSPEAALLTAQRIVAYSQAPDVQLSGDQTQAIIDLANELADERAKTADAEQQVAKLQRRIKSLETERKERPRATPQKKMLEEYRREKPKLLEDLRNLFPNSPVFSGESEALRMVAGEIGIANLSDAQIRRQNLVVAKEMEQAGKDAQTIWLATGWEKGVDGKWRNEIDDLSVNLTPIGINLADVYRSIGELPFVMDSASYHRRSDGTYDVTIRRKDAKSASKDFINLTGVGLQDIIQLDGTLFDRIKSNDGEERLDFFGSGDVVTAKHIKINSEIDHNTFPLTSIITNADELFKAYPALRNVQVAFDTSMGAGERGAFFTRPSLDGVEMYIAVNPRISQKTIQSTLLHEAQHAIQRIEGFAAGGNLGSIAGISREDAYEIEAVAREIQKVVELKASGDWVWEDSSLEDIIKHGNAPENIKRWAINIVKAGDDAISQFLNETPSQQYRRLAGEVEARNVQKRNTLSTEERKQTPLSKTEDIARENQIVTFQDDSNILRMAAPLDDAPLDADTIAKLAKYAAGEILEGKSYKTLISELEAITGAEIETVKEIHAMAVDNLRGASKELSDTAKERIKRRQEHYREATRFNRGIQVSNVTRRAMQDDRYKDDEPLIEAIERLTGPYPKSINDVINDLREIYPDMSMNDVQDLARKAKAATVRLKAEMQKERDEAKGILAEERAKLNEARIAKAKATVKLNKFLTNLATDPNVIKRFNNDMRAKFVSNWGTQIFNAQQALTLSTPAEMMIDLLEIGLKHVGLRIGETPDVSLEDIMLPYSYIFGNYKQLAESALSEFPDQFYEIHSGLLGDIEIEPLETAGRKSNPVSRALHKWFDKNQVLNDKLAKITGAKLQEMHFRNAIIAATFDQIIRNKSNGTTNLEQAVADGTVRNFITEQDAQFAANKAMRVTFAALIDDKVGRKLKHGYDWLDSYLPIFLNPVVYARFTYTTTKIMVANPILFGMLDSAKLGGKGYTTRSLAQGVLAWSGIATAAALMSLFGDDDDEWHTLKFGDTTIDIRRHYPVSSYFYMAHLIRNGVGGKPLFKGNGLTAAGKEVLEGFASLETDYFNYGAGMKFVGTAGDAITGNATAGEVGTATSRLIGNTMAGYLRFFKPMRDVLAQIDNDEAKQRFYQDTAQDEFIKEISRSVPLIARAYNAETAKDARGEDILQPFPAGRIFGINVVHPSYLRPKQSTATAWATKLFRFEGSGQPMTAEQRKAFSITRALKNAIRRGDDVEVKKRLQELKRSGELSKDKLDRLEKDLKMSELEAAVKWYFNPRKEKDLRDLRQVWKYATDEEKNGLRKILKSKAGRTREFNQEFGL